VRTGPDADLADLVRHLTALLFVSDEAIELGALARILDVTTVSLERAVVQLASQPPPGLILQRLGRRLQLATDPASAGYVRRLRGRGEVSRLSRAALEALSVIAYRQPTTRAEIERVRGVNSDHALETLLTRGLVADLGRRETVGRPAIFGTTLHFLELAGLRSLDDLPPLSSLHEVAGGKPPPSVTSEEHPTLPGDATGCC